MLGSQRTATGYNGTPGARSVEGTVNGKSRDFENLKDGVVRSLDISKYLSSGGGNRVSVKLDDCKNGSMDVLVWEGTATQAPPSR